MPRTSPMDIAISCAKRAAAIGEVPIGAVIMREGKLVSLAHNLVRTRNDPLAHAECLAIRYGSKASGRARLVDCDLYVTIEPCAMCAQAVSLARLRRLYIGALDPKGGGVEHGARVFDHPTCHHRPEIYTGIGESEAAELLKEFFKERR